MAYTLEITNGTTTYSFDVQPIWKPRLEYLFNETLVPAELTAEIETWELVGAVYRNATPASVTSDFATLSTLLSNRSDPVDSVKFKSGSTTIRELNTTTHAALMVTAVDSDPGPDGAGHWTNHWRGSITIVGKKLIHSSNIVKLERRYTYSYDDAGLLTQTLEGRIETMPGTSAKTQAEAQADASLGAAFIFETGGDSNIEVRVENAPEDTIATFRQVQREIGLTVPATATSYRLAVETAEIADGKITTIQVSARGTSVASARTAVRAQKPGTSFLRQQETEDRDGLGFRATYTKREPRTATVSRYGLARVCSMRRAFEFIGGGQDAIEDPIPGYKTFVTLAPWRWLTVRESVRVTAVNVATLADIPLPAPLWPANLQPNQSSDSAPELDDDEAENRTADRYVRKASRVYVFPDKPPDFGLVLAVIINAPKWQTEPDYVARVAVGTTGR